MSKQKTDGFTESWICVDCGVNTAPGIPDGPTMRSHFALLGECQTSIGSDSEVYTVRDAVWKQARMKPWGGCLCIGCLEERLGRKLKPNDFEPEHPFNKSPMGTPRLLDRRRPKAEWIPPR